MANIPQLPGGVAIATTLPNGQPMPYGPHCSVETLYSTAVLTKSDGMLLAKVSAVKVQVAFGNLDDLTVQYTNRFLEGTGRSVIKDWRTGNYRLKGGKRAKRNRKPITNAATLNATFPAPVAATTHTAQPKAEQEEAPNMASGAVITVSGDANRVSTIPGMVYLPQIALKGAGRGNTDVGGIVVPTEQFKVLEDAWHLAQAGKPAATLLTGPSGTAKTMLVRAFAAYLGVGYLKVDAGAVRTADDWAGAFRQDPNTKTWAHRWSPLALALREGKPCIIHVDELTRTETPAALNAFMGLLDETGTLLVPDANAVLTMPKGILVVATANIGPEFVGTLPLDGAVRQRFPYGVRMTNPSEAVEAKVIRTRTGVTADIAERLVRMANQQRQHRDDAQQYPSGAIISTRILLSIAERISERHADPREAVISVLHGQFDPGDDAALSIVIESQFPKTAPKVQSPGVGATIIA